MSYYSDGMINSIRDFVTKKLGPLESIKMHKYFSFRISIPRFCGLQLMVRVFDGYENCEIALPLRSRMARAVKGGTTIGPIRNSEGRVVQTVAKCRGNTLRLRIRKITLTRGTVPVEDHLLAHHLEPAILRNRYFWLTHCFVSILDRFTPQTDHVVVRTDFRLVAGNIRYWANFLNEPDLVEFFECLVDSSKGNHREAFFDLLINSLNARMFFIVGTKGLIYRQPLTGYLKVMSSKGCSEIRFGSPFHDLFPLFWSRN